MARSCARASSRASAECSSAATPRREPSRRIRAPAQAGTASTPRCTPTSCRTPVYALGEVAPALEDAARVLRHERRADAELRQQAVAAARPEHAVGVLRVGRHAGPLLAHLLGHLDMELDG